MSDQPGDDEHSEDRHGDDGASPVDEGLQHLEAAARELVQAGRSFLEAVESALGRPGGVESFLRTLSRPAGADGEPDEDPDDETGYEDIPVDR